jgi:hypothetical protein
MNLNNYLTFLKKKYEEELKGVAAEPIINESLSNCWQCANCVYKGYINNNNHNSDAMLNQNHQSFKPNYYSSPPPPSSPRTSSLYSPRHSVFDSNNNNNLVKLEELKSGDLVFNPNIKEKILSTTPTTLDFNSLKSPLNLVNNKPQPQYNLNLPPGLLNKHNSNVIMKKKRHRRTKEEIQRAKMIEQQRQQHKKQKSDFEFMNLTQTEDDYAPFLTLDTLTQFQKQVIMREFCEIIYHDNEESEFKFVKKQKMSSESNMKPVNVHKTNKNNNNNNNNLIFDNDPDVIYIDTEASSSADYSMLDSSSENVFYENESSGFSSNNGLNTLRT